MTSRISPTSMPGEIKFLCMLHNIGATTPEKSLTLEEIAVWTAMGLKEIQENLRKSMENNYIQSRFISGLQRYYLAIEGVRTVLSIYS